MTMALEGQIKGQEIDKLLTEEHKRTEQVGSHAKVI